MKSLKKEVEEARKTSSDLEKKYTQAAEDLDSAKSQVDDLRRQNQMLEKRLQETLQGKNVFFCLSNNIYKFRRRKLIFKSAVDEN